MGTLSRLHLVSGFHAIQKIDTLHVKSAANRGMSVKVCLA